MEIKDQLIEYQELLSNRLEWESAWRLVAQYLLPGRGLFYGPNDSKPINRYLISKKILNTAGSDALRVLSSGLQGGLTSPSRPWFSLGFSDPRTSDIDPLKRWLQECESTIYQYLASSNFYPELHTFYREFGGFCTGGIYVGEGIDEALHFECLTAGEYVFTSDENGLVEKYYRTIFYTYARLIREFGEEKIPETLKEQVKLSPSLSTTQYFTVLHTIRKETFRDKPYTSEYTLIGISSATTRLKAEEYVTLRKSGYYEQPIKIGRWDVLSGDEYGTGPGFDAVINAQRLQEMEKAYLVATHKAIDPPLNVPSALKGQINTLPGALNYAPQGKFVEPIYKINPEFQGMLTASERVERSLQRIFYNDLFLTASRDPDASPLRTGEVQAKQNERLLMMGPVIERLYAEVLSPTIERVFNILLRKNLLPEIPAGFEDYLSDYEIQLISPLAQSQKSSAGTAIQGYLQFIGAAASTDPTVLDWIDGDETAHEMGDILGVPRKIIRKPEDVKQLREARAKQQAAEKKQQNDLIAQQAGLEAEKVKAETLKTYSDAGANIGASFDA